MHLKKILYIGVVLMSAVLGTILAWNTIGQTDHIPYARMLEPVEIGEYEGERLSAIAEFRENSIKGS